MKIAIVNDLPIAVETLRRVLRTVNDYELVWVATNGMEAVQKCAAARPDLILMDLLMPIMNGAGATRWIMNTCPCAILLVTSSIQSHLSEVFSAMCDGALDVVLMPILGSQDPQEGGEELLTKIARIAKLIGQPKQSVEIALSDLSRSKYSKKKCHPLPFTKNLTKNPPVGTGKRTTPTRETAPTSPPRNRFQLPSRPANMVKGRSHLPPLVVIGASAGGPKALATILSQLPQDFGAAIAIAQHIDAQFSPGLANWLDRETPLTVELARVGAKPEIGKVLIAGRNDHLVLNSHLTFSYSEYPQEDPYRPSVNALFNSIAQYWPGSAIAVLLTGMGNDGAVGLKSLRSAGWHTIAQDRASCAVYGMPKAAVQLGAAVEVLPLEAIAPKLLTLMPQKRSIFATMIGASSSGG